MQVFVQKLKSFYKFLQVKTFKNLQVAVSKMLVVTPLDEWVFGVLIVSWKFVTNIYKSNLLGKHKRFPQGSIPTLRGFWASFGCQNPYLFRKILQFCRVFWEKNPKTPKKNFPFKTKFENPPQNISGYATGHPNE